MFGSPCYTICYTILHMISCTIVQSPYSPNSYNQLVFVSHGTLSFKIILLSTNHPRRCAHCLADFFIGVYNYLVLSNSKMTIIHTMQFRNFAGESPQNSRDPACRRSTRKDFKIHIKKQRLKRLTIVTWLIVVTQLCSQKLSTFLYLFLFFVKTFFWTSWVYF